MAICKAKKRDGQACTVHSLRGSELCYFHAPDPEMRAYRKESQSKGGRKRAPVRAMPPPPADFNLDLPSERSRLRNYAANALVRGQLETNEANGLAYLCDCAIRDRNAGLNERIEQLDQLLQAESHKVFDQSAFESRFIEEDTEDDPRPEPKTSPHTSKQAVAERATVEKVLALARERHDRTVSQAEKQCSPGLEPEPGKEPAPTPGPDPEPRGEPGKTT